MNYIQSNKAAWEEAFHKHQRGYAEHPIADRLDQKFAFLNTDIVEEFKAIGLENKCIAQFCCINPEDLTYCGLDCEKCDVHKATIHGDEEARIRAVESWTPVAQEHWGLETLDPSTIECKGCRSGQPSFKGYGWCPTRACAQEKDLSSCGLCPEWQTCDYLAESMGDSIEARANLEAISKSVNQ